MISIDDKKILVKIQDFLKSDQNKITIFSENPDINIIQDLKNRFVKLSPLKGLLYATLVWIRSSVFGILYIMRGSPIKNTIYRLFGVNIGKGVYIAEQVVIDNIFPKLISIGDGTIIGRKANLLNHSIVNDKIVLGKIIIGKKSVIGSEATILPGVTIKEKTTIGLKALVTKELKSPGTYVGIPVKKLKK